MKIARIVSFFSFILFTLVLLAQFAFASLALAQTGGQESPGGASATPIPISASATPAPSLAQAIRLDTPLTVHLSGTTPISISYKSTASETISVTARSLEAEDVLDPMLTVLDPSGSQLASNDDHRTNRTDLAPHDSLIDGLALPAAGRYVIQVAAVDASMEGDVEVVVTEGSAPTPEETSADLTVSDRVPDNAPYVYDFQAKAGEVVTISVRATDNQLDPTVSLRDSSDRELASNDDQTTSTVLGPYDSEIAGFTIPASGTYTVQITGFAGVGGTFTLTIARGGQPVSVTPQPTIEAPTATPEQSSQVVHGSVESGSTFTYSFDGNAGDVYIITALADTQDFDPRMSIYLNDNYVADNDDYGTTDPGMKSTDSRIYDLILAETGTYEIDVHGYSDSSGDFTLTLDRVATGAPTGSPDEHVELGTVAAGDTYSYSFDAQAGDYVTITARYLTLGFDPYITLMDSNGTVLLDNDNEGSIWGDYAYYDAKIPNYHITETGTYTVEVSGGDGSGGTFGLTIGTRR